MPDTRPRRHEPTQDGRHSGQVIVVLLRHCSCHWAAWGEVTWPSYEYLYNHPTALELGFVCLLACLLCYRDPGRPLGLVSVLRYVLGMAPPAPSAPAPVPAPAPAPAWRLPMCLSACLSIRLYSSSSSSSSSSSRRSCEWRWTIRQLIPKKRCQRSKSNINTNPQSRAWLFLPLSHSHP
ncbi:hypothetical protein HDV57DRAFT_388669 [Trichoderma longibrachiatum]|uniref:Uncharacterized protein n=1 Tax=Trichoderma longibrachiatum ATCC 18648 TaxID=983965 RepID=A0A2T4C408_TRILO|nr:hypothetical protein M440DRAFT_317314 [Trichoderma longibrachiatum ATCC 18648]